MDATSQAQKKKSRSSMSGKHHVLAGSRETGSRVYYKLISNLILSSISILPQSSALVTATSGSLESFPSVFFHPVFGKLLSQGRSGGNTPCSV